MLNGSVQPSRLTTCKRVLIWGARMVCYFYTPGLAHGVMVEVDIRALVEAVMRGSLRGRGDVVVHVCKAVAS